MEAALYVIPSIHMSLFSKIHLNLSLWGWHPMAPLSVPIVPRNNSIPF
jgi:hypothetical protein